ncbi:MAG TPA: ABC transporter substrate-binding protein, partial [Candidatus Udaeobacter sp.]|nr:ABC transporter substrate-binding protein [Candidatus Udaeobacter sp.]
KERYPFIALEYSRASHEDRAVRTIIAFKNKRFVTDIITGLGGTFFMYKEINALEDMRNIPNLKNNPPDTVDPEGLWVGMHMRYWCMAYNTRYLKKEDMPKRWDDLLTNPKFRSGNLALALAFNRAKQLCCNWRRNAAGRCALREQTRGCRDGAFFIEACSWQLI